MMIQHVKPATVFLPPHEVPQQNLKRLRPGDRLAWVIPTPRCVVRTGYRLSPMDFIPAVQEKLRRQRDVIEAVEQLCATLEISSRSVDPTKLAYTLSHAMCHAARFGGPERGIVVQNLDVDATQDVFVEATRCVHVGTRYAPQGYSDDYDPGGLRQERTIILVRAALDTLGCPGEPCWLISGDLRRLPPKPEATA